MLLLVQLLYVFFGERIIEFLLLRMLEVGVDKGEGGVIGVILYTLVIGRVLDRLQYLKHVTSSVNVNNTKKLS